MGASVFWDCFLVRANLYNYLDAEHNLASSEVGFLLSSNIFLLDFFSMGCLGIFEDYFLWDFRIDLALNDFFLWIYLHLILGSLWLYIRYNPNFSHQFQQSKFWLVLRISHKNRYQFTNSSNFTHPCLVFNHSINLRPRVLHNLSWSLEISWNKTHFLSQIERDLLDQIPHQPFLAFLHWKALFLGSVGLLDD